MKAGLPAFPLILKVKPYIGKDIKAQVYMNIVAADTLVLWNTPTSILKEVNNSNFNIALDNY